MLVVFPVTEKRNWDDAPGLIDAGFALNVIEGAGTWGVGLTTLE